MKLNAQWHTSHKMPKNASLDDRVTWHLEHAANCSCRPLHGKILEEIQRRGIPIPDKSNA